MCPHFGSLHTTLKVSLFLISYSLSADHKLTLYWCLHGFPMLSVGHLAFSCGSACSTVFPGMVISNHKMMEWKNKKAQVLAHHLLIVRLKNPNRWMYNG